MKTDITPWARATMTPEDWAEIHAAEPKDAKVHANLHHKTRRISLSVVYRKAVLASGTGSTVREAWDARHAVEPLPEIVGYLNG